MELIEAFIRVTQILSLKFRPEILETIQLVLNVMRQIIKEA